jgi:DNA repair exonuclease SbcCD ATPase subunit
MRKKLVIVPDVDSIIFGLEEQVIIKNQTEMLTNLQIRNFRHNERVNVKLARITIFRGPSGSGKSSLIGALKWTVFNQPSGTDFIHWDHNFAAIRLGIDKKHVIIRKRSKTENYYKLNGCKYEAFGTGVPSPVTSVLNMSPLNFQRQHAGPFWFRETAGEVSRQLNAIVNLDLIDTTLANLGKEQRRVNYQVKDIQQRIEEAKREKIKLQYIVELDKQLIALEKQQEQYISDVHKIWQLSTLLEQAKEYQVMINRFVPDIKPLMDLYEKWEKANKEHKQLTTLFEQAKNYEETIVQLDISIKKNEQKLKRLMGKRCPLCERKL